MHAHGKALYYFAVPLFCCVHADPVGAYKAGISWHDTFHLRIVTLGLQRLRRRRLCCCLSVLWRKPLSGVARSGVARSGADLGGWGPCGPRAPPRSSRCQGQEAKLRAKWHFDYSLSLPQHLMLADMDGCLWEQIVPCKFYFCTFVEPYTSASRHLFSYVSEWYYWMWFSMEALLCSQ